MMTTDMCTKTLLLFTLFDVLVNCQIIYQENTPLDERVARLESELFLLRKNQKVHGCFSGDEAFCLSNGGNWPVIRNIKFPSKFEEEPVIAVGIRYMDAAQDTNVRVNAKATGVTKSGFTLRLETWSDTKLHCLGANWMACSKFS